MTSADLEQAIVSLVASGSVKVPPYPAVAFQIEKLVRSGDFGLDALGKLVSSDQVLSADVLRCANSAVYSRGAAVSSVSAAVARIGAKDVSRLALASGLAGHASQPGALASLRRRVWVDSLASAMLSQALAPGRKLAPDVAFAAGLLHDFGKVIALACIEDLIAKKKDAAGQRPVEAWDALVERFHVELGVVMAARWDLPPLIADAVSLHHAASLEGAADPRLVETVMVADRVTALLRERIDLAAADLEGVALLQPAERPVVLRTAQTVPQFVASFDSAEVWRAAAPSAVAPPPPPRRSGPPPPPYAVELSLGARRQQFKILGLANTHLMLSGTAVMPEHLLLSMEVKSKQPVKGFASVKLVWPENGTFTLLVQPYALAGEALDRWRALVAESLEAAA